MATSLKPSRSMSPVSSTAIPNRPVTDDGESKEVKPPNCSKREKGKGGREKRGRKRERGERGRGKGGRDKGIEGERKEKHKLCT